MKPLLTFTQVLILIYLFFIGIGLSVSIGSYLTTHNSYDMDTAKFWGALAAPSGFVANELRKKNEEEK